MIQHLWEAINFHLTLSDLTYFKSVFKVHNNSHNRQRTVVDVQLLQLACNTNRAVMSCTMFLSQSSIYESICNQNFSF